jgi:type VI secretion system secreted protein VgrG
MEDSLTQANRFLTIQSPLEENKLILRSFSGHEGISKLFNFQIDLVSEDHKIDFNKLIGQKIVIGVRQPDNENRRYFSGYISRFAQLPAEGRLAHYQAEMVPWLWFLTRTSDCRIFQNETVPDIIQKVFTRYGFKDFDLQLRTEYQPWEYCVQYRESACNFVMRLMEEEGIYFFFRHEKNKHILVMGDSPSAHKPILTHSRVRYEHSSGQGLKYEEDVIDSWRLEQQLRPGRYALNEYYFETPANNLISTIEGKVDQGGNRLYEVYDYPGQYEKRNEGTDLVRLRMEEEEASHTVISGAGNCRNFVSGHRFELSDHFREDQNGEYVITSISHNAYQAGLQSGPETLEESYNNIFTCIPYSVTYRPTRGTPKPFVQGCQTATVVGPKGEEIYTDKYGRVKVQFHWDRVGKRDEHSSCWIRVSHPWAGKGWGAVSIPRIGQEVIVDFLEGDPDRPIITGRVYNAEQMPPYPLPSGKVMSGIKTNSTKGGSGYNEMSMDDTKGKEKITIHAQYDMATTVEHDDSQIVHNNRSITVDGTHTEEIKKDTKIKITEGTYEHDVVAKTAKYHVKGAVTETFDDKQDTSVNKEIIVTSKTAHIHVTAATEIRLHTGLSELLMKSDGTIVLSGKNIRIAATQEAKMGVSNQTVVCNTQKVMTSGAAISSTAVGQHDISGALIKIN